MEATFSYWKPVFYLLEAEGFACWLLYARRAQVSSCTLTIEAANALAGDLDCGDEPLAG